MPAEWPQRALRKRISTTTCPIREVCTKCGSSNLTNDTIETDQGEWPKGQPYCEKHPEAMIITFPQRCPICDEMGIIGIVNESLSQAIGLGGNLISGFPSIIPWCINEKCLLEMEKRAKEEAK